MPAQAQQLMMQPEMWTLEESHFTTDLLQDAITTDSGSENQRV